MTPDELAQKIRAKVRIIAARRSDISPLARSILDRAALIGDRNARALEQEIKIADRVNALKQLAADTTEHYQQTLAASGLPPEHFKLRLMLLGRLPPPPRKGE